MVCSQRNQTRTEEEDDIIMQELEQAEVCQKGCHKMVYQMYRGIVLLDLEAKPMSGVVCFPRVNVFV